MARVACGHKSMLCYILYLMELLGSAFQVNIITAQCCVAICVSVYAIHQFLCDHYGRYGTAMGTSFVAFILILCLLAV